MLLSVTNSGCVPTCVSGEPIMLTVPVPCLVTLVSLVRDEHRHGRIPSMMFRRPDDWVT